jgi:SAM-dependent methyltransferase
LSRDLKVLGHDVIGVDASATMLAAARAADPGLEFQQADAASLPFSDGSFDLVLAFMSLQDIDDVEGAVAEAARVLAPGGRFCIAIVHPLNSAGSFAGSDPDSPFVIEGSYLEHSYYADEIARDGFELTLVSSHRSLESYAGALANAGLVIEQLREPAVPHDAITQESGRRWQRLPLFLHIRAAKP